MWSAADFTEHMEVVGSDGQHVGTVDRVDGAMLKLTKSDPAAHGEHHAVRMEMVEDIRDNRVVLRVPAQQAKAEAGIPS